MGRQNWPAANDLSRMGENRHTADAMN